MSVNNILSNINRENQSVPEAIEKVIPNIEGFILACVSKMRHGGRLFYLGAGTSGRLGIVDASECPPTFGTPAEMVVGLIAGGEKAIHRAVENAEDSTTLGIEDLKKLNFNKKDIVVGIAASGRTPYVISSLEYANELGATTIGVSCNSDSALAKVASIAISVIVGPEVVTGSTRLKSGTAQKLVLNMLTTISMIKIGKVYGNLMVDVEATNEKLVERQKKIVIEATGVTYEEAQEALLKCNNHCKTAIFMILSGLDAETATKVLKEHNGFIREALKSTI